jgi:hypothetical protein
MTVEQLQQIASDVGLKAPHASRTQLIHQIQLRRGKEPCFSSEKRHLCTEILCEWRQECRKLRAAWMY